MHDRAENYEGRYIMVDKINGQKYYEYEKINQTKKKTVDTLDFQMDLERQGVIYEKSEEKKKSSKVESKQDPVKTTEKKMSSGVKVEISNQGREKAEGEQEKINFSEQIRKYAIIAVNFLKSLWDKIWNEPEKQTHAEFPAVLEESMEQAEEKTGEYLSVEAGSFEQPVYTQEEIRAIFRRGNRKEIENFLSDNGQRHLVKNSDLLTQYDKTGMIVGVNRSDKELILHGDKNKIKL